MYISDSRVQDIVLCTFCLHSKSHFVNHIFRCIIKGSRVLGNLTSGVELNGESKERVDVKFGQRCEVMYSKI